MIGVDQVVVGLWFLPVVSFIILPLFVACFGLLYSMFGAFKPVAGQESKAINAGSKVSVTA